MKYVASCSGGKDSVAMVLGLIEKEWPLDCVVFCDLGKEFDSIYRNWDQLCGILDEHRINHAKLKMPHSFDYYFAEKEIKEHKGGVQEVTDIAIRRIKNVTDAIRKQTGAVRAPDPSEYCRT